MTRVGGLEPISHPVLYIYIYKARIIFSRKGKSFLFLERILKKLSIQLMYIYIKRNKQVVTVSSSLPLHDFKATISRDLSRHVSGCFQLSGIIFSPEGIERAGLKRNESPPIHPSHHTRARGILFVRDRGRGIRSCRQLSKLPLERNYFSSLRARG